MDSIRVSEAPDPGSIPGEATSKRLYSNMQPFYFYFFQHGLITFLSISKCKNNAKLNFIPCLCGQALVYIQWANL